MNRLAPLLFILLIFIAGCSEEQPPKTGATPDALKNAITVLKVVDGDSLEVMYQGKKRRLRLMGIDAPEYGQEWGEEAEVYVYEWTQNKPLHLTFSPRKTDKYDRILAYVWNGDHLLNLEIVRAGLALPYMLKKHEPYFEEINQARKEAKHEGTGFWQQGGLKMEPRIWRKKNKP